MKPCLCTSCNPYKDKNGLSPLTAALDANQNASAIALLEGGARVEFCAPNNDKQFTLAPLVFACKRHGSKDKTGKAGGRQSGIPDLGFFENESQIPDFQNESQIPDPGNLRNPRDLNSQILFSFYFI